MWRKIMIVEPKEKKTPHQKQVRYEKGKLYYSEKLERRLLFVLTLLVLAAGAFYMLAEM
jgi:hypothetical protein